MGKYTSLVQARLRTHSDVWQIWCFDHPVVDHHVIDQSCDDILALTMTVIRLTKFAVDHVSVGLRPKLDPVWT